MTIVNRRHLLAGGGALAASAMLSPVSSSALYAKATEKPFNLDYAPHFKMFSSLAGDDFVDQINFAADQGFRSWEDNRLKSRSIKDQERIGQALSDNNMTMGVFVASNINWREPTMVLGDPDYVAAFLNELEECVEVAKRVGAKWTTVVPGHRDLRLHEDYQMANIAEALKRGCEIYEKHDLVIVLEPLNNYKNHPGLILREIPQAYYLCKAVGSPSCKILFDIYHQQIQEGNIIPNIDLAWQEIAYFQIGDNPGRKEPTTGEINYKNIFKHIHGKGYTGLLGMEHGNSRAGADGEQAVIDAYRKVDSFL